MYIVVSSRAVDIIAKFIFDSTGYHITDYEEIALVDEDNFDSESILPSNCGFNYGYPAYQFVDSEGTITIQIDKNIVSNMAQIEAQLIYLMCCMNNDDYLDIDGIALSSYNITNFIEFDTLYTFLGNLYNSGLISCQ